MLDVTRLNRIPNKTIREKTKVTDIMEKIV